MLVARFFGVEISGLNALISGVIVMLMSGFILYDTSEIIQGKETNYLFATTNLFLNIFNIFLSLLNLFGFFCDED